MPESMKDRFILRTETDWHVIDRIVTTQSCAIVNTRQANPEKKKNPRMLSFILERLLRRLLVFVFIIR